MSYELEEIKQIRKQIGLTQSQLANASNVSQSLVAKIEAGRIDPTFSKAQKIFSTLQQYTGKKELKADEIMNKKILSVDPETTIKDAINLIKKNAISQAPVIKDNHVVGFISEAIILDALLEQKGEKIKDIMGDVPPVISKKTSINVISDLLKFYQMVVVSTEGKVEGVITRTDVLKNI